MDASPPPDTLVIPPDLLAEIQAEAARQHRPALDILQDAVRVYVWEGTRARQLGLPDADDGPMTDEDRAMICEKIAEGIASAKAGRLVDGDAVFARIYAEMDMLERQQRE